MVFIGVQSLTSHAQQFFIEEQELENYNSFLPRVAFWLVPRQPEREIIQSLMTELADQYLAPEFIPHVTVYSCRRSSQQEELAIMAGLAGRCPAVTLRTDKMVSTDILTRALFTSLNPDKTLTWLREILQKELPESSPHGFDPHLSLLYQFLSPSVRSGLAQEVSLPLQEINFNQIWAVAIPETLHAVEDLSGWQTLLSCRLASSAITGTI